MFSEHHFALDYVNEAGDLMQKAFGELAALPNKINPRFKYSPKNSIGSIDPRKAVNIGNPKVTRFWEKNRRFIDGTEETFQDRYHRFKENHGGQALYQKVIGEWVLYNSRAERIGKINDSYLLTTAA